MISFSIIIPTYNRAQLISETIRSVLAQSYPHYEIIIVDDGSKDDTGNVVRSQFTDKRVSYYHKQNEERGAARNFGIKHAKGDYALFFDSDDLMKPNYLDILIKVIRMNPGIFMLAAKYNFIDDAKIERPSPLESVPEGWYDRDYFLEGNILACNYCIRINQGGYHLFPEQRELASMEDWLFLLHNLHDQKIYIRDEIGLSMREHDDRSMANNQKVIEARNKATAWALESLNLNDKQKKKLRAWSHYFCGIHQYLDHKRSAALKEVYEAIRLDGPQQKFLILLAKAIVGRKTILKLK